MNQLIKLLSFFVLLFSTSCINMDENLDQDLSSQKMLKHSQNDTAKSNIDTNFHSFLSEIAVDEMEEDIKKYVEHIQRKFSEVWIEHDSIDQSVANILDAYVENETLYGIVKETISEKGKRKMELFYKNDSLICVLESYYSYKFKIDFEDPLWKKKMLSSNIPESTMVLEELNECYFVGDKLIRWRDKSGRIGESKLVSFKNAEINYLKCSKEYRTELQKSFK